MERFARQGSPKMKQRDAGCRAGDRKIPWRGGELGAVGEGILDTAGSKVAEVGFLEVWMSIIASTTLGQK